MSSTIKSMTWSQRGGVLLAVLAITGTRERVLGHAIQASVREFECDGELPPHRNGFAVLGSRRQTPRALNFAHRCFIQLRETTRGLHSHVASPAVLEHIDFENHCACFASTAR